MYSFQYAFNIKPDTDSSCFGMLVLDQVKSNYQSVWFEENIIFKHTRAMHMQSTETIVDCG